MDRKSNVGTYNRLINKRKLIYLFFNYILGIFGIVGWVLYVQKEYKPETLSDRITQLEITYSKFKQMTGKQLHILWNDLFFDAEYKLDGKIKENKYDCVSAEWKFFKILGSNVVFENTKLLEMRLNRVTLPHKSIKTVEVGDLIIFKRNELVGHVGIVEKVNRNLIRYMDMNVLEDGAGYNTITFNDPRISAIYPTTFDFWCGDILYQKK